MTVRTHSVKHVRSKYRKFQYLAAFFAALTIVAGFLTAASGLQITQLQKLQAPPAEPIITPDASAEEAFNKEIEALNSKLSEEQTTSDTLRKKIKSLERRLAALKKAAAPTPRPKPKPVAKPIETPKKPDAATAPPVTETVTPQPIKKPAPIAPPPTPPAPVPETAPRPEPVVQPEPKPSQAPVPVPADKPEAPPIQAPTPTPVPIPQPEPAPVPEATPATPEKEANQQEAASPPAPATAVPQAPPAATAETGKPSSPAGDQPLETEAMPSDNSKSTTE